MFKVVQDNENIERVQKSGDSFKSPNIVQSNIFYFS